jgi:uncharacterized integral membrane protein (TIGR00698 family)
MKSKQDRQKISVWENNLFGVRLAEIPTLLPGLAAVLTLTWVSIQLSDFIGTRLMGLEKSPVSPVILAIMIGLLIGAVVKLPKTLTPGFKFAVTVLDVFKLGAFGVPVVALCIIGAYFITTRINKVLKLPERLGTLIAVGTSICGVTAIVAASPAIDAEEEESAYAVAVITVFGLFATLAYPYLANAIFDGEVVRVGLFLGTSVHETAQVVGAGKIYSDIFSQPMALDVATITKLVRNVFMAFVIPYVAYSYAQKVQGDETFKGKKTSILKLFPVFILGFLMMAAFRSIGDVGINSSGSAFGLWMPVVWGKVIAAIKNVAEICLVSALAGVGLSTRFQSVRELGWKPFLVGLAASLSVGLVSYAAILLLGNLLTV